jgi:hypothetical protein
MRATGHRRFAAIPSLRSVPVNAGVSHKGENMQFICKLLLIAMLVLVSASSTTGGDHPTASIETKEANDSYRLSVPVSQLTLTLPKGTWSLKAKSIGTRNPRYFYFEDKKEPSLILSGWFEPARLFIGVPKLWDKDTQSWKKEGLPQPINVSFEKLGGWDTVMYDHSLSNLVSSHLRAHWVQSGTWIDIHLSTTTARSSVENRRALTLLLAGISVSKKDGG